MTSYHKRVDANHTAMVTALRQIPGVGVFSIAVVGGGKPDLVVAWRGATILVEVKAPGWQKQRRPSGAALKRFEAQQKFRDTWPGNVRQCETVDDVLRAIGFED